MFSEKDFFDIIEDCIDDKVGAYIFLSTIAFEMQKYDLIIPLLSRALELDKDNLVARYNLSFVLYYFGENKMALEYLKDVEGKTLEIDELANEIRAKIGDEKNEL